MDFGEGFGRNETNSYAGQRLVNKKCEVYDLSEWRRLCQVSILKLLGPLFKEHKRGMGPTTLEKM